MDRTLSAPGKLFLAGEYAVLWGGLARVVGIGPRVRCMVRPRADRQVDVVVADGRLSGPATPAGVRWERPVPEAYRFVATTIDLAFRLVGQEGPGFSVAFESSPTWNGTKLGMGSSARAAVLAAEASRVGLVAQFDALKLALVGHADAQGGKGSGGDVATSFAGGMVRYRKYVTQSFLSAAQRGGLMVAMEQSAPVDLVRMGEPRFPMLYAFSGQSASTPGLVKAVESRLDPAARQIFVERSDGLSDALETGLLRGDFAQVIRASDALQQLLWSLEVTRDEGLGRILQLAKTFGCTGKQSGAGGGDGAVLFAPDGPAREALCEALTSRGIHAFPVSADKGLQGEVVHSPLLKSWLDAL